MEFDGAPMETTQAVSLGTTIMAASFDGGVILGADTRTSSGSYIANRVQSKLTPLTENVYIARSGSAADTQAVATYVHYFLAQHMAETGEPVTVKAAANMVMQMAYQNKSNLTAGMIVAGWDAQRGGTVWAVPIGGTLVQTPFTAGGSGSIYINGFCDRMWRPKMSEAECRAFVTKAVSLAMARDGSSGGCIRLVTVTKDGAKAEFIPGTSIPAHYGELAASSVPAALPA